jgi:uncharacterized protein YchJ
VGFIPFYRVEPELAERETRTITVIRTPDDLFSYSPPKERVPRRAPCPCGSGKKYKQCCMWKDRQA